MPDFLSFSAGLNAPAFVAGLVNHLWQSTVVAAGMLGLLAVSGRLSARARWRIAWLGLSKFVLPAFAFTVLFRRLGSAGARWLESPVITLPAVYVGGVSSGESQVIPAPSAVSWTGWSEALILAWLGLGIALFAMWLAKGMRNRARLMSQADPISGTLLSEVALAAKRVGLKNMPRCVWSHATGDLGVIGIFRPILVVPRDLEQTLTASERLAVLVHEMIHLRHRDPWWNALQALLHSFFWFIPAVWLLNRRLRLETEKACDEGVIELIGQPGTYASGIIKMVRQAVLGPTFALGAATPPLTQRIQNILTPYPRAHSRLRAAASLGLAAFFVVLSGRAGALVASSPARGASSSTKPAAPVKASAPRLPPASDAGASSASLSPLDAEALAKLSALSRSVSEFPAATVERELSSREQDTARSEKIAQPESRLLPASPVATSPALDVSVVELAPPPSAAPLAPIASATVAAPADGSSSLTGTTGAAPRPTTEVLVGFVVDTKGNVTDAQVVKSSHHEFDAAAVSAVSRWKFTPGRRSGVAVSTRMRVPVRFPLGP
jgi:TonB family protein